MATQYRLFCQTENSYVTKWASSVPTVCPNNVAHTIQSDRTVILKKKFDKIIISQDGLADFTTITAALAANAGQTNTVFEIYPGTYVENNPLYIPPGCVINSVGTPGNVVVVGANPTQDIFYMTPWSKLYGIMIYGSGVSGCRGVYYNGAYGGGAMVSLEDCIFQNCDIGVEVEQGPDTMIMRSVLITTTNNDLSKGIYIHNGGLVIANYIFITGTQTNFYNYGVYMTGQYSKASLTSVATYLCNNGLFGEDQCMYEISLITIRYCVNAVTMGTVLPTAVWRLSSLNIQDSFLYDLNVLGTKCDVNIFSGQMDDAKIYNPNNVIINARYQYVSRNRNICTFLGDVKYGTPLAPTKISIGEGRHDNIGNICFSNSNLEVGTWVDNTNASLEEDGITFNVFQGTAAGNCCYIGSPRNILGLEIETVTASTSPIPNADIVYEYWNGSSWVNIKFMQSYDEQPFYTYVNYHCFTLVDVMQVRFGITASTPFALKTLNGQSLKWVRIRIVNTISSVPVCNYIKLHCSQTEINGDGFIEHYGNARVVATLPWKIDNTLACNSTMASNEIFVSSNVSVSRQYNKFSAGSLSRIGLSGFLPQDIDISFPIKIKFSFICDSTTAGNVQWNGHLTHTVIGSNIYSNVNNAPADPPTCVCSNVTTTISANNTNKEIRENIEFDVNDLFVNPRPDDGNESLMWLSIARDATSGNSNDTYPGNIYIIDFQINYIKWCGGNHIASF